jgi:hypothetical protein
MTTPHRKDYGSKCFSMVRVVTRTCTSRRIER